MTPRTQINLGNTIGVLIAISLPLILAELLNINLEENFLGLGIPAFLLGGLVRFSFIKLTKSLCPMCNSNTIQKSFEGDIHYECSSKQCDYTYNPKLSKDNPIIKP